MKKLKKNQYYSYGISLYWNEFVVSVPRMRALKENISVVQCILFFMFSFMLEGNFLFTQSRNNESRIKIQL